MKGEKEAMKIFEIVKRNKMLPADQGKLEEIRFIGTAAMAYYRAKLKLMDQLGITEKQRDATLADGQDAGEMLLDVEVKLGEIYQQVPKKRGGQKSPEHTMARTLSKSEQIGQPRARISETEQIAKHPDIVKAVKAEARDRKDIPTKTAVLKTIKNQRLMNELKEVREEKKRERILNKKKPPSIDKYLKELEIILDDGREKLAALVGQTGHIDNNINRETFKISLVAFINVAEKIRKEL